MSRYSAVSAKRRAAKRRQRNAVSANCPVPNVMIKLRRVHGHVQYVRVRQWPAANMIAVNNIFAYIVQT